MRRRSHIQVINYFLKISMRKWSSFPVTGVIRFHVSERSVDRHFSIQNFRKFLSLGGSSIWVENQHLAMQLIYVAKTTSWIIKGDSLYTDSLSCNNEEVFQNRSRPNWKKNNMRHQKTKHCFHRLVSHAATRKKELTAHRDKTHPGAKTPRTVYKVE